MNKQQVKSLAEKHGVKKPMMKGDYSEAFYAFAAELSNVKLKRLRDEAEKLRLKGKGDGKITTAQLSEVLDEQAS